MSNLVEANLAKTTGIVGIAVGICGLGNVICGFIWLGHNGYGGHGLWSGFGLIFAAVLGMIIWRNRNKNLMIFFLVTCIILVIVMIIQAAIAAIAYVFWSLFQVAADCRVYRGRCHCRNSKGEPIPIDLETCELISLIDGLFLAITIFSALGTITTLAGSIIGCLGTCCATNQQPGMVVVHQPAGTQSSLMYTSQQYHSGQYPAQNYPPQYPSAGHYPPPQYPAATGPVDSGAIPPKA